MQEIRCGEETILSRYGRYEGIRRRMRQSKERRIKSKRGREKLKIKRSGKRERRRNEKKEWKKIKRHIFGRSKLVKKKIKEEKEEKKNR